MEKTIEQELRVKALDSAMQLSNDSQNVDEILSVAKKIESYLLSE